MKIGYARVSTGSGEQLSALEAQVARVEAAGVDRVISDVESGLSNEREGMNELLELIDSKRVREIVTTRVDRLGRDATATDSLIVLCGKRGVTITTLDGGTVEAETPTGFLMARLSTSLAEMESKMISLRIRRGLEQRRKNHAPCRGKVSWGYRLSEDKVRIEPNPETWDDAKHFLHILREAKWRMYPALQQFDRPCGLGSVGAVKAWLLNPILRGGIGYLRKGNHQYEQVVWDLHEPLISHAEFRIILIKLEENRRQWGQNANRVAKILTGLCYCTCCRQKLSYAGGQKTNALICRTGGCRSLYKSTPEKVIIEAVNNELSKKASELGQSINEEPPEAAGLRDQIDRLEKMNDPDLDEAIAAKRAKLRELLTTSSPKDLERVAALAQPEAWAMATEEELRLIYLEFVSRIYAERGLVSQIDLKI